MARAHAADGDDVGQAVFDVLGAGGAISGGWTTTNDVDDVRHLDVLRSYQWPDATSWSDFVRNPAAEAVIVTAIAHCSPGTVTP
ncbi:MULTISPECIES: hypothetical protein [Streptomyces]|uniref:hypothetical protein n=1 Tax=Streptomyces TaxID=1883 RepID=UPI002E192664|nr:MULTISPECIES: hypothetical protein [unclassified Streptomyces]